MTMELLSCDNQMVTPVAVQRQSQVSNVNFDGSRTISMTTEQTQSAVVHKMQLKATCYNVLQSFKYAKLVPTLY